MNKQQYLMDLESALRAKKVQDIEDILGEYEQHFVLKMMNGYSEEEEYGPFMGLRVRSFYGLPVYVWY